ncbi:hypothetical protein MRX96_028355 [Rhipicephalus microplus]
MKTMTTESEVGGSSLAADKESTPSQDTDGSFPRKRKRRRESLAQRHYKASRHRRGPSNVANRCSSGSQTTAPSTDLGGVPSLAASNSGGATSQRPTQCLPENAASLGVPLISQPNVGVEAAEQHIAVAQAAIPCISALQKKREPLNTADNVVAATSAQQGIVANTGASASYSTASQLSRASAEAPGGSPSRHAPINFRDDGVSQDVLPGTSATPHQLQPRRGSHALAVEGTAKVSALQGLESIQTVVASPPRVANNGVTGRREVLDLEPPHSGAAASAGSHTGNTPIHFRGDGVSQAGLSGTSVTPHHVQPCRGIDVIAVEVMANASALLALESIQAGVASPLKAANQDVADQREVPYSEPALGGAAAMGGAAETHVAVTRSTGTLPLVPSTSQTALAAVVQVPSADVSTYKRGPREDTWANKPPSPSELKRRACLVQHSFAEMVASGTSAGRHQLLVVAAISAAASLMFLVVSALVLVLLMRTSGSHADGSDPCLGLSDCYQHMALIASRVNHSIDPCQDFSAHVCSAWSAPEFREFASTQDDVVLSWARQFRDILETGTRSLPTGEKAIAFYRKCIENTSYANIATAMRQLRQFMAERGIPWPEQPTSPTVTPLGVLFDLAINWQLPLWYSVHLSPLPESEIRAVVLTPSILVLSWERHHREILGKGAFVTYYTAFENALESADNVVVHHDVEFIRKVARLEGTILQELANAEKSRVPPPGSWQFPLSDATRHTPSIPAEQWLSEANKNFDVTPAVTDADLLMTANGVYLKAVDSVFAHYDRSELLTYLAWFLAQVLAPAADPSLLVVRYGSEEHASVYRPLFCAAHVEVVFRVLIISLYAIPRFSATLRNNVDALLRGIRHTASDKLNALSWLDETSKIHGRVKLGWMNTTLWPAPDLLEESELDRAYRNFGWSNGSTFFETWLENRRAFRRLIRAENFNVGMPANLALPLIEYDYLRNSVRVSVQSLSRPVFYGHGTLAMFYGGLGFLYAREMVKALDSEGSRRDDAGALTEEPWMSLAWRDSLVDPAACLEGASAGGYFPEIPALEISYAALESAFSASETSARERIAERRLFFLTLCYFLCSGVQQHPVAGGDCNKAVANFEPFAEAYGCPYGARMRPRRRCSFFDK